MSADQLHRTLKFKFVFCHAMPEPILPTESVIIVLSIAATRHRRTASRLALVSRWVGDLVEPILYRVLALKRVATADAHKRLYSTKFRICQRLGVVTGAHSRAAE
jgi:hypothetical protein